MTQSESLIPRIGITWQPAAATGWGLIGLHLSLRLISRKILPVWFIQPDWRLLDRLQLTVLASAEPSSRRLAEELAKATGKQVSVNYPLLVPMGNNLESPRLPWALLGKPQLGIVFLENPNLTPQALERGKSFSKLLAGSAWCADKLRHAGLENVSVLVQGVDRSLFHPAPKTNLWKDRFVIFSGGKLEYRKGQDIVIAAVREFQKRHPETILIFAWHNAWPQSMKEIDNAGLVEGSPPVGTAGETDFPIWLKKQNLSNFIDLGALVQPQLATLMREADVALFPNRCEGGTNLVAMEAMASGIPTILSANTGHLDLIQDNNCYPLKDQKPVKPTPTYPSTKDWGESSLEEILASLEAVHSDRPEAARRAQAAAAAISHLTWDRFTDSLLEEVRSVL